MTKIEIIDRVKVLMEEISPFDDGLQVLNSEVQPIQSYIEKSIPSALDELLLFCPLHYTTGVNLPSMTRITSGTREIGIITVPDDFIRIHTIKATKWERPVHRHISVENPEYTQQLNPYTRGGNAKPVVVKNQKLELYTLETGDTIETAKYVQRPDVEDIQLNQQLYEPLCYLIASKVYAIFNDKRAEYMIAQSKSLLQ